MFMLIYDKLKTKPFDILLNLKIAIQLYGNSYDYLIVDDCMYTGTQIVENVLYKDASETLYKIPNSYIIAKEIFSKTLFTPVSTPKINIHLFIPYISHNSYLKINDIQLLTCLNIILYEKYIVNNFKNVLDDSDSSKLLNMYSNFYNNINPLELTPIFFDHKISDTISTIELILIKGQVLDNPNKKLIFIDVCEKYSDIEKSELYKILICPQSPYHLFKSILENKLK